MQQVRVKAYREVRGDFEYLFERAMPAFEPIFDRTQEVKAQGEIAHRFEALELVPPEHVPWYRVTGLQRREEPDEKERYRAALTRLSPEAGAFVLMSMRRRSREQAPLQQFCHRLWQVPVAVHTTSKKMNLLDKYLFR